MSNPTEFTQGALPVIRSAGPLYSRIMAMQVDDIMEVTPAELPPSYRGVGSMLGRIMRKYPRYFAVLKLDGRAGWKIMRVKDLVTLKSFSSLPSKSKHMEENMPERNNTLGDATLAQQVDEVIGSATRDTADLTPRGVTAARLTALELLNEAFKDMPDDVQMQGGVSEAVATRQESYNTLTNLIGNVRTMAQNIFGAKPAVYGRFGFEGMISESDNDLVALAKRVKREAADHAADLLSEGWTPTFATAFGNAITDFDDKRDLVKAAEGDRKQATEARILAGNTIYTELEKICNTGKDVYRESDPAKYEDYVIYETTSLTTFKRIGSLGIGISTGFDGSKVHSTSQSVLKLVVADGLLQVSAADTLAGGPGPVVWSAAAGTHTKTIEEFAALIGVSEERVFVHFTNPGPLTVSYNFSITKVTISE